jgi:hypothetical protein
VAGKKIIGSRPRHAARALQGVFISGLQRGWCPSTAPRVVGHGRPRLAPTPRRCKKTTRPPPML